MIEHKSRGESPPSVVVASVAAAFVLFRLQRRQMFRGQLIRVYFLAYFVYRFATEFIRHGVRVVIAAGWRLRQARKMQDPVSAQMNDRPNTPVMGAQPAIHVSTWA